MDSKTQAQAIRYADNDLREAGLPTYSELMAALGDCRDRLRLLIDSDRHKLLDAVAEQKAAALMARAGGAA